MKVGRNEPCPCGSGKKYKKCCFFPKERTKSFPIPSEVIKKAQKHQQDELKREQLYGKIRPIIHTNHTGHKVVAVGSEVYLSKKWKTFQNFLSYYITQVLGKEWGKAELEKPFKERHQIIKWFDALHRFGQSLTKKGLVEGIISGVAVAYLLIAYDLYILKDHQVLQEYVIRRLKHPDQFQGARYELFATATCIKAGFNIEFEDEKDRSQKHTEFIATHRATGYKIAVEAKSRHRKGVLGYPGIRRPDDKVKLRIVKLLNEALGKKRNHPLVIFVDVNVPPNKAEKIFNFSQMPNELTRTVDKLKKSARGNDLFDLILVTNHPYHYVREDEPDTKRNVCTVSSEKPVYPQLMRELHEATNKYGNIPIEFPKE